MNFKYSIKERMLQLSMIDYKKVRKELPKLLGKTLRTFDRYCNIKSDEFTDVPAQDLDIIASYLDCTANDLKNYFITKMGRIQHKITQYR